MNMNPYLGFRKVVNFKSLLFSLIQMLYNELKWTDINKCDVYEKHARC